MLDITCRLTDGEFGLVLKGDLAIDTVTQFEAALATSGAVQIVTIDCTGLCFLDSTGVGALLRLSLDLQETGGRLRLMRISNEVHELLETLGLVDFLGAEGR